MYRLQAPLPSAMPTPLPMTSQADPGRQGRTGRFAQDLLGHHYQRDEVMRWADACGDSVRPVPPRGGQHGSWIVFCGVHFMAESADVLTGGDQVVILPDLNAGCSMADMADDIVALGRGGTWESIASVTDIRRVVPITYMNSSANAEGVRRPSGSAVCTSSNARSRSSSSGLWTRVEPLALTSSSPTSTWDATHRVSARLRRVGHTDGAKARKAGHGWADRCRVKRATFLLCVERATAPCTSSSSPQRIADFRAAHPDGLVIAHPECAQDTVVVLWLTRSAPFGSTDYTCASSGGRGRSGWLGHRRRYRDPSRQPAGHGVPGQDGRLARPADLPVLDHVPHRCRPLGMGTREPGRGDGREPDQRRSSVRLPSGVASPSIGCWRSSEALRRRQTLALPVYVRSEPARVRGSARAERGRHHHRLPAVDRGAGHRPPLQLEIVLVDGQSTDSTADVAEQCLRQSRIGRYEVIINDRQSRPANLNQGLAALHRGDVVCPCVGQLVAGYPFTTSRLSAS